MSQPPVSRGLLQYLEDTFPDRLPDAEPTDDRPPTERDFYFLMGQQRVIRNLRAINRAQEEDALTGDTLRTGA